MSNRTVVDESSVAQFLSCGRLALVGASDDPKSFARTVSAELTGHGYHVVPVNPAHHVVDGETCYPSVSAVPGHVDGAILMTPSERSAEVARDCVAAGVRNVWLFKGLGGGGATSDAAAAVCRENGVNLVDGACPLMFLEPVGWFHRVHHRARQLRGTLTNRGGVG